MAKKEKEVIEESEEVVEEKAPEPEPTPEPEPKKEDYKQVNTSRGLMKRFPDGHLEPW